MKFVTLFIALALYAFSLVNSLTVHDEVRCQMDCDVKEFKQVCGTDESGDTKTFNNLCILKTENCLRNLSYQKTADGNCP